MEKISNVRQVIMVLGIRQAMKWLAGPLFNHSLRTANPTLAGLRHVKDIVDFSDPI
jgi:hypothetical protein